MAGLLDDPQKLTMLMSGLGLLTSKTRNQADRWKEYGAQGLLAEAQNKRKITQDAPMNDLNMQYKQAQLDALNGPKDRKTLKGADDRYRYTDTGELVFPDLQIDPNKSPFKDPKEDISALQATRSAFDKANATNTKLMDTFSRATDVIRERGDFTKLTGADDTLLMKSMANMILPGESVMGDDLKTIQTQSGLPAYFSSFVAKLSGGGTLDPTERAIIYQTMNSLNQSAINNYEQQKTRFKPDIEKGKWPVESFFRPQPKGYEIPEGLLRVTPKPVQQQNTDPIKAQSFIDKWFNNEN